MQIATLRPCEPGSSSQKLTVIKHKVEGTKPMNENSDRFNKDDETRQVF